MIVVAGVGPGNPKYLTSQVEKAIEDFETVVAFGRVSQSLEGLRKDIVEVHRVAQLKEAMEGKEEVLILASGDPLFYGVTKYLMSQGIPVDDVYPGISSFQFFMSRLKKPWQDYHLISLHGRDYPLEEIKNHPKVVSLMDKDHSPSWLSKELAKLGLKGKLIIGYRLSYPDEKIEEIEIGDEALDLDPLAVVVVEHDLVK